LSHAPSSGAGKKPSAFSGKFWTLLICVFCAIGVWGMMGSCGSRSRNPAVATPEHVASAAELERKLELAEITKELRETEAGIARDERRIREASGLTAGAAPVGVTLQPLVPLCGTTATSTGQGVVDNTIYLALDGQREVTLELSTSEWTPWIAILATQGMTGGTISGMVTPELGFKAQVADELVSAGASFREVTVRRGSALTARGLRRIRYKALEPNQSLKIKYCD